jgi:hypothetical protein
MQAGRWAVIHWVTDKSRKMNIMRIKLRLSWCAAAAIGAAAYWFLNQ